MLFLVFGSSAAGKTSALAELRGRIANLAVHDFDEIGVPAGERAMAALVAADSLGRRRIGSVDRHGAGQALGSPR